MSNQQLQQKLFILLSTSDSLLALPAERQVQLRERLGQLSEDKLLEVVTILEKEQQKVELIKQNLSNYASELQELTQKVHIASSQLSRTYAVVQEEADQKEDLRTSEELLLEVDKAAEDAK